VEVLVHLSKESSRSRSTANLKPCPKGEKGEMQVGTVQVFIGRTSLGW
jgi:hypothetical protein